MNIRFVIFVFVFSIIFALIAQWVYLLFKKAKINNEKKWNKINEVLDNEAVEMDKTKGQKLNTKNVKTFSKNKSNNKKK